MTSAVAPSAANRRASSASSTVQTVTASPRPVQRRTRSGGASVRSGEKEPSEKLGAYDAQDRLLSYGASQFAYTKNGELRTKTDTTTSAVTSYSYDALGNLTHVDLPDGRAIDYLVDATGRALLAARDRREAQRSDLRVW